MRARAAVVAAASLLTAAAPAHADRAPTRTEAKAIRSAFLAGQPSSTKVVRVRVSTTDRRFAAVTYRVDTAHAPAARAAKVAPAKAPALVKRAKGTKWKTVPTAPAKVLKDLKADRRSDLHLSGDITAHLTRPASCTVSDDFFSAGIRDPATDVYVSVEIPTWRGFGTYGAMAIHSIVAASIANNGAPQYETGQAADASAPSGDIFVEPRWGIIEATLHHVIDGSEATGTVDISGSWACR